ncbi:LysR substrate-binding domain-containing protein [Thalassotalea sp. PLHSN55]|uniref:LysR family transcriptional regulator n=1 Tax=Thalassotalea sp. PLHSN55 TaxID=3435888 RepID=UPI003F84A76B
MNLKRLGYFCQLAEEGNFTRTAEKIGIAQPALTIAIKKLEQELELTLINRSEKKAYLTADGKLLYQRAKALLAQAAQMQLELSELKDHHRGSISLGVSAMMGSYYFPQMLSSFKQKYPNITIHLIDQGTASLEQKLLNGELDLALVRSDQQHENMRYMPLIEEEVVAAMASEHVLAQQQKLSLAQFCQQPLVLFHQGYFLREVVSRYAKSEKLVLDVRMETNLIELQKSLVANNVGITTCLARIAQHDKNLTIVPFQPAIKFKLGLAWKSNCYLSKASKAFIEHVKQKD